MKKKRTRKIPSPFLDGFMLGASIFMVLCAVLAIGSIGLFFLLSNWEQQEITDAREYYLANTVDQEVVLNLCTRNAIPESIADCANSNLTLEFWEIRTIAESYVEVSLSYGEVSEFLEDYEIMCNLPDRLPEPGTFRCAYEFDVGYTLIFVFSETSEELLYIE